MGDGGGEGSSSYHGIDSWIDKELLGEDQREHLKRRGHQKDSWEKKTLTSPISRPVAAPITKIGMKIPHGTGSVVQTTEKTNWNLALDSGLKPSTHMKD